MNGVRDCHFSYSCSGKLAYKSVSGIRDSKTRKWGKKEVRIGALRLIKGILSMFDSEDLLALSSVLGVQLFHLLTEHRDCN